MQILGNKNEIGNFSLHDIVTPIKVHAYEEYLRVSRYNRRKSEELVRGFTEGFDIRYRGPKMRQNTSQNIPITVGSVQEMWDKLLKETKLGRHAGPFEEIPYKFYMQSPIGLVPKSGNQTRLIFHLSYDFGESEEEKSLNYHTPDDMCAVKYRDLDYAIQTCLRLDERTTDRHRGTIKQQAGEELLSSIFMTKSDLKSAFRILPILPSQRFLLIMKCKHPETGKTMYWVDKCLPFGASISCARFQSFSDSLHHIIEFIMGRHFTITNYLDDYLFIAREEQECNDVVRRFLQLCNEIGCPVSLEKTEWASMLIVFLGILLDGKSRTLSVPLDKRQKALNLLLWAIQRKKVTVNFIQKLTGTLNFINKAIVPGRVFTRAMYSKLK